MDTDSSDYAAGSGDQSRRTLRSLTFSGTHKLALLKNLTPKTWYNVDIAASNSAGETRMSYKLATTLITGGKNHAISNTWLLTFFISFPYFFEYGRKIIPSVGSIFFSVFCQFNNKKYRQ